MGKKKRLQNSIGMIWKVIFQMGPDDTIDPMVLEMKEEDKKLFYKLQIIQRNEKL